MTITRGREETSCSLVIALQAVKGVLTGKTKANKLSRMAAKKRKVNGRKQKRTPNTTRSTTRIDAVQYYLEMHNKEQLEEDGEKK